MADKRESNEQKVKFDTAIKRVCTHCSYSMEYKGRNHEEEIIVCPKCKEHSFVDAWHYAKHKTPAPPKQTKPEKAGSLSIELEVDSDNAVKKLKAFQRELKATIKLMRELDEISNKEHVVNLNTGGVISKQVMTELKNQELINQISRSERY